MKGGRATYGGNQYTYLNAERFKEFCGFCVTCPAPCIAAGIRDNGNQPKRSADKASELEQIRMDTDGGHYIQYRRLGRINTPARRDASSGCIDA